MSNGVTQGYRLHTPTDTSDPGFRIPGKKLHWVSPRVSEINPGRPWVVIRKSDLPKELATHIENHSPAAFAHGDTIRRGELVLAYSSEEVAKRARQELNEIAREREASVSRATHGINNPNGTPRAKVEVNEDRDVSREMIEKFKAAKQDD